MLDSVRSAIGGEPLFRAADFLTITEALDYAAKGRAGLTFYSARGEPVEHLAYARLRDEAMQLACRMRGVGLRAGDRLAVIAETSAAFVRTFFACQYAAIVPVPLPLPASFGGREAYIDQLRRMIEGCNAAAAVGPPEFASLLADAAGGIASDLVGSFGIFDGVAADTTPLPPGAPQNLCYLQFSSGSTRRPTGVAVTQRALMSNVEAIVRAGLQVGPDDRAVSWLPFYHDMGLVGFLLAPLAAQIPVDYLDTRDFARRPLLWLSLLSRNKGTISYSPSFGYELCARRADTAPLDGLDLSRWRAAGIGGDMIRPQVLRRFASTFASSGFNASAFVASYGLAEATLAVSFAPLGRGIETERVDTDRLAEGDPVVPASAGRGEARARDLVRCGVPLPNVELEIRDAAGTALPEGVIGRIFVRGPAVMAGYFNDEVQTKQALTADGWLDTGDLGYRREGALVIAGRSKDLIIVNGRNVWPQDLEWAAEKVPGVRSGDVAAFSIEDDAEGAERVVLAVECRLAGPELRLALAKAVVAAVRTATAVDCEVVLVAPRTLPHTSSGKLSRTRAKQDFLAGKLGLPEADRPAGAVI